VKNHQVTFLFELFQIDFVNENENEIETPGPISNTSISTTKNGVTRLIRRGLFSI